MISFIIPAYNEEKLLPSTLDTLFGSARAAGEPFEVIVADDASTDRTAEVARERGAAVVSVNRRQIAATRNAGAREAKGDILAFVDADTLVSEPVLRAMVATIRAGAAGGGARIKLDGLPRLSRLLFNVFIFFYHLLGFAGGCFIFARRDAFDAAGGFDESYYAGEEGFLCSALRRQGRFVILRESVLTSGRKGRMYGIRTGLVPVLLFLRGGFASFRRREGLGIWYDGRREG